MSRGVSRLLALVLLAAAPGLQAAELAALAWLSGHWGDGETEEFWLPPQDGLMLGLNRSRGQPPAFEYLRIVEEEGAVSLLASPSGRAATRFALAGQTATSVVFANPAHDFPQRISYRLVDGALEVEASAGSGDNRRSLRWRWVRRNE